jgi:hypothetical protein
MSALIKAAGFVDRLQWKHWDRLTFKPDEIQQRLLLKIVQRNREARFGRDHGFSSIGSLRDYRKQVPLTDYEGLRSYVDSVKTGEPDVLTAEPVVMFTVTSGSTGDPKLIPVTARARENHRQLTRLWYHRALADHPELFNGKLLGVVSPAVEGRTAGGIPFGAASGLIYQQSPRWIQNTYAVPYEVAEVKESETKYYLIMRLGLEHDISFIGTPNPSTILKLIETVNHCKEDMIRDIRDGTIAARCNLTAELRAALARRLEKNPARALRLESLIKQDGALRPREYWPRLKLIGCWKGGSVAVRLKEFPRWFGGATPVRDLGYMASEAQMTLPVTDSGSAGILAIDKNFYEFIPEPEIGAAQPTLLTCTEIEEGKLYYPVLTTPAGLYRYDINDVIRVAGFYNRTPLIEFVRKGRDVTSITGEKLHVNHLIEAMTRAERAAGFGVQHFRACADAEKSLYVFAVELDGTVPSRAELARLLAEIDAALAALNLEYAQKRESRRLGPPVLCVMKTGWFERSTAREVRAASRDAQFKAALLGTIMEDPNEVEFEVQINGEYTASPT